MLRTMKPDPCSGCSDQELLPAPITLRRLQAEDCLEHLTAMLHRAFSRIGEMGIPCSGVDQVPEVTRQRIERGDCFVALSGQCIVGTITLYAPDQASDSRHYRDERVASVRQFAVDPLFQGRGLGSGMLKLAERWASRRGYAWLALDTPESASHLLDYYRSHGFRLVETLHFSGRPYRSALFTKPLLNRAASICRASVSPGRRLSISPTRRVRRLTAMWQWNNMVSRPCRPRASPWSAISGNFPRRRE